MRLLALDTATPAAVVGVLDGSGAVVERRDDPPPGERPHHADRLLVLAADALAAAGLRFTDLDRVAVGTGPGGFTGLRIGIATARAHRPPGRAARTRRRAGRRAPGRAPGDDPVLAVLDARRGEAFVAGYEGGAQTIAPRVAAPGDLPALVARRDGRRWRAVGDGALRFRDELNRGGAVVPAPTEPVHRIGAAAVCDLAASAPDRGRDAVVPDYLRAPDADSTRRARTP